MKLSLFLITFLSLQAVAAKDVNFKDQALKMVPGSSVLQEKQREVRLKTPHQTVVEVEFETDGEFEESSGSDVTRDEFVPGQDLKNLKDVYALLVKEKKSPLGEWSLDKSLIRGWYYEVNGTENGKAVEYIVDAKSGKLLDTKLDD